MEKELKKFLALKPDVLAHKLSVNFDTAKRIQNRVATAPALLDVCYETISLLTGNPDGDDERTEKSVSDLAYNSIEAADPEFKIVTY